MRVVDGNVRLFGNFDFFKKRVKGFVRFVSDVRAVDSAVFGSAARYRDEFSGVAVTADFVFKTA